MVLGFQPNKRKCDVEGGEGKKRISMAIMGGWRKKVRGGWSKKVRGGAEQNGGGTCAVEMGFRAAAVE